MNYETIEDEVYDFVDDFFNDELYLLDENFEFIDANHLYTPNTDYTNLYNFLCDLLAKFQVIDSDFKPTTVIKLNKDVKYLKDTYKKFLIKTKSTKDTFKNHFLANSNVINDFTAIILELNDKADKSEQKFVEIKHMKQNLIKLKDRYNEVFEDIFYENVKNINENFKILINTKIFYLDRFVWNNASKSKTIVNHMKIRKIDDEFNAQSYLKLVMSIMRPYSDEYKYLQQCLEVYKR
jgi:hypothetical protein